MPEQILDNLYRLYVPLKGNPLKELNAYLIKGSDRNLLIDTGFRQRSCREALFRQMRELGLQPGDVDVLLTHLHSDHTGLAVDAAAGRGRIFISRIDSIAFDSEQEWDARWDHSARNFILEGFPEELILKMKETNPAISMSPPHGVPVTCLEDGDIIEAGGYRLQCLLMPGHTPGQMCFWMEEQKAMFLGDHVLFDITPNITAWAGMDDALGTYMDSLRRIRQYDVRLALPGHRGSGDVKNRVDELLEHHSQRLKETIHVINRHPGDTAYQIAGGMTWKIHAASNRWEDFPLTQKWFAVGEALSHLQHLIKKGLVRRTVDGNVARYWLA